MREISLTSFHVELRRKTKVSRCEEYKNFNFRFVSWVTQIHLTNVELTHTPNTRWKKKVKTPMWGLYRSTKFLSCIALRNYVNEHKSRCMELSFAENHTTTYHVRNKVTSTMHDCTQSIKFCLLILIS